MKILQKSGEKSTPSVIQRLSVLVSKGCLTLQIHLSSKQTYQDLASSLAFFFVRLVLEAI
jgi:hypothetical protein